MSAYGSFYAEIVCRYVNMLLFAFVLCRSIHVASYASRQRCNQVYSERRQCHVSRPYFSRCSHDWSPVGFSCRIFSLLPLAGLMQHGMVAAVESVRHVITLYTLFRCACALVISLSAHFNGHFYWWTWIFFRS